MGFFGKRDNAPGDAIEYAPEQVDSEKQSPPEQIEQPVQTEGALIEVDPVVEKRLLRKLDLRLPTLMMFLYVLASLDRSNIGNAKTAGMEDELHLDGHRYEWLLTIFYIPYIVFEFLAMMWKIIPPNMWAAITVTGWGIMATCQAAAQGWSGMMALRFFLGVFEAGFGPGVPFLMSFFYRRNELGLRCGLFLSAAPLASTFAGALAYGITSGHALLANWRLLFLVEGVPTFIGAVVAYLYMPNSVSSTSFLTEEEKQVASIRSMRHGGREAETEHRSGISLKEIGRTLLDAKAWFTAFMYFSCNVSFSSLPVFLPTILKDMGFTSVDAQGLTAPPYFLAFLATLLTTWIADRLQQRGLMIALFSIIGAVGYVLLATCIDVYVRYAGVFLAAVGVFPCIANILPWTLNNQGSDTSRGVGIVLMNVIGQCGPLLGTNVFPSSDSPRYIKGQSICAAFMFFNMFLTLGLRTLLVWENKKLDEKYGRTVDRAGAGEKVRTGEENFGADFRFVL